jgi:hypothetical protein
MEEWLTEHLRPTDVVALYAPDEYEILLCEVDPRSAMGLVARMRTELAPLAGGREQITVACYPVHGRTPEELISFGAATRSDKARPSALPAREPVPGGALDRLRPIVERVAAGIIPVLVVGETGVGKDVLASRIHALSPRSSRPFVCVNCAALPEQLLESELFGYERGAFTGAAQRKLGLLESADGGTVFLDELGELPLSVQAKLLRVLDQREVLPLGALKPRAIDVRFVAATNRDLELEVQRGTFREDLFASASPRSPPSRGRSRPGPRASSIFRMPPPSDRRRWSCSSATRGRATFASFATSSIAPYFWRATGGRSASSISRPRRWDVCSPRVTPLAASAPIRPRRQRCLARLQLRKSARA